MEEKTMALTDENNGFYMPVAPAYGGGYGNGNGFGADGWWVLLLLLCGWGGMGGFGGFGGFGGGFGGMYEFPWLLNGQSGINNNVNDGFRDAQLHDSVTSVRDGVSNLATQLCGCCGDMQMSMANGFSGVQQSLCNGFAGTTAAITGAQNAISQQLNANEIASLNRSFAEQTANMQGFNGLNTGVADLRYTVATEACADRAAVGDALQNVTMQNMGNTNAIVNAITAGIQSIKDDLCQDRLDAERRENQNLRSELMYARGQASQVEQTAQIRAGQATTANQLVNELRSCPIPSQPVYGNQPIFTCGGNNGCGCGCGGSF
jgi:hypothetical protein